MRRYVFHVAVTLLTLSLGIAIGIWFKSPNPAPASSTAKDSISIPDEKGDVIEIVFRDLMQRYQPHSVYFLSFAETDPSDEFMARFKGSGASIQKLSRAIRNQNQVIDRESGVIGVHLQAGIYYPISECEIRVGATWELSERLGKDPKWTIWSSEYHVQKVEGKWAIKSYKVVPPIH